MADFKTHVTFSSILGCGYAAAGYTYGVHWDTALVAGGLCGISGMLPDLDSDHGVPLRETMAFAAGILPMLLVDRFQALELRHDTMVLAAISLYFFVRFGVAKMIARYTVHRGMFHSIPAGLIFAGTAFLCCGYNDLNMRYYKAAAVFVGFMSHLLLDEIYSIEVGRLRVKKSFGTALKFFGPSAWANISTYAKLAIVIMLILGEPTVMQRLDARTPGFASSYRHFQDQYLGSLSGSSFGDSTGRASSYPENNAWESRGADPNDPQQQSDKDQTIYDTARRLYHRFFD